MGTREQEGNPVVSGNEQIIPRLIAGVFVWCSDMALGSYCVRRDLMHSCWAFCGTHYQDWCHGL
jgi:hypothetical protein